MLVSMGFTVEQAQRGLTETNNDVERALDWIMSHPDASPSSAPLNLITDGSPSKFFLIFFSAFQTDTTEVVCRYQDGAIKSRHLAPFLRLIKQRS